MSLATIELREVLAKMDAGEVFSLGFRTYDKRKERGGEWIEVEQAQKFNHRTPSQRREEARKQPLRKDPRHYENSTRNITVIPSGEIRKVHLRLMRKFNGKTIL